MAASLPADSDARSNVVLYLPPGPLFQGRVHPVHEEGEAKGSVTQDQKWSIDTTDYSGLSPQQALASMTPATVVTFNYRLGATWPMTPAKEESIQTPTQALPISPSSSSPPSSQNQPSFYKYPTPIHDTLTAFDWIQTHLRPTHLGIIGSHIGGSLALMLALTEAQSVKAVAAISPVCDWPGLDEYCAVEPPSASASASSHAGQKPAKRSSKKKIHRATAPPDLVSLLAAREEFFASPERCFDAFASPVLFLRSAGRDVPRAFPEYLTEPGYPIPVLKNVRQGTGAPDELLSDSELPEQDELSEAEAGHTTTRRRKALSRWPPYGLDYGSSGGSRGWGGIGARRLEVTLPWVRVYVDGAEGEGKGSVLADQGEEMVSLMRRACFFGREKGFGERRVSLVRECGGLGEDVGRWFEGVFEGRICDE